MLFDALFAFEIFVIIIVTACHLICLVSISFEYVVYICDFFILLSLDLSVNYFVFSTISTFIFVFIFVSLIPVIGLLLVSCMQMCKFLSCQTFVKYLELEHLMFVQVKY